MTDDAISGSDSIRAGGGETAESSVDDTGRTVAFDFEIQPRGRDDWHRTIQRKHPSETFGTMDGFEYRNVRPLVYADSEATEVDR